MIEPFTIAIEDDVLQDLKTRLRRTRLAPDFNNDGWDYGTNGAYLQELIAYWAEGYDWRRHERNMNAFPHFRTMIDGVAIHFMHARGVGPKPMPLIMTHGWPWTFWDLQKVIGPLTDPAAFGGDPGIVTVFGQSSGPSFRPVQALTSTGLAHRGACECTQRSCCTWSRTRWRTS